MKNLPLNEEKYLAAYLCGVVQGDRAAEAASALFEKYGRLDRILERGYSELENLVGAAVATAIKLLGAVISRSNTDNFKTGRSYEKDEIEEYLRWLYFGRDVECVHLLFFDKKDRLVAVSKISEGTVNSSEITPRRALEAASRTKPKAASAILSHNHPGGVVSVSEHDAYATLVMRRALESVNVKLLYHVVVAGGEVGYIET